MRRKDRERSKEFALEVIDQAPFAVLGLLDDKGNPYTVPLSICREDNKLYFHSAQSGKKVDIIKDGDTVSVSFVSSHQVPQLYSRAQVEKFVQNKEFNKLAKTVFTTGYASAHVMGTIKRVEDLSEKAHALQLICDKYTPNFSDLAGKVIENGQHYTAVYCIEIVEIAAKQKAFNKSTSKF